MPAEHEKRFLPAAGHDLFLPLYDSITKWMGADRARLVLVEQAGLCAGQRVLDIGCGTGTLAVLVKQSHPDVEMVGLDPDPKALRRAEQKAQRAGVTVQFDQGFADALPYGDAAFDCVLSSFMFHHLDLHTKERMFQEVRRVLKPGGRLHLMDFGGPEAGKGGLLRWFHPPDQLAGNTEQAVLSLMAPSGLSDGRVAARLPLLRGLIQVVAYRATAG